LLYDDIRGALNGPGRIIEFTCSNKNEFGDPDPSVMHGAKITIQRIMEGVFENGMANGFQRHILAFNKRFKLGYFLNDKPFGKFVEF